MVQVLIGDLFSSEAQTWVNTVNCVGVMGRGVALGFKQRFPKMFEDYAGRCERGEVQLGRPYLYRRPEEPWILNFPTKDHWRSVSKLDDIERGGLIISLHVLTNGALRHWRCLRWDVGTDNWTGESLDLYCTAV